MSQSIRSFKPRIFLSTKRFIEVLLLNIQRAKVIDRSFNHLSLKSQRATQHGSIYLRLLAHVQFEDPIAIIAIVNAVREIVYLYCKDLKYTHKDASSDPEKEMSAEYDTKLAKNAVGR